MKRRLVSMVLTALVLCTLAFSAYASYYFDSGWMPSGSTTEVMVSDIDLTKGHNVTVTIANMSQNFTMPVGGQLSVTTGGSLDSTETTYQLASYAVTSSPVIQVFHQYTVWLAPVGADSVTGGYIEIDISGLVGSNTLPDDLQWKYVVEEISTGSTNDSYQEGYNAGYSAGDNAGYTRGYGEGYNVGKSEGSSEASYQEGYNAGYSAGDNAGYTRGYEIGDNAGYTRGYEIGDNAGYTRGYGEGYNVGKSESSSGSYAEGFAAGKAQGQDDAQLVDVAINGFFDSLTGFIEPFTSIGIGGITIGAMLTMMVTVAVVLIIIKVVRG